MSNFRRLGGASKAVKLPPLCERKPNGDVICKLCKSKVNPLRWQRHEGGPQHRKMLQYFLNLKKQKAEQAARAPEPKKEVQKIEQKKETSKEQEKPKETKRTPEKEPEEQDPDVPEDPSALPKDFFDPQYKAAKREWKKEKGAKGKKKENNDSEKKNDKDEVTRDPVPDKNSKKRKWKGKRKYPRRKRERKIIHERTLNIAEATISNEAQLKIEEISNLDSKFDSEIGALLGDIKKQERKMNRRSKKNARIVKKSLIRVEKMETTFERGLVKDLRKQRETLKNSKPEDEENAAVKEKEVAEKSEDKAEDEGPSFFDDWDTPTNEVNENGDFLDTSLLVDWKQKSWFS